MTACGAIVRSPFPKATRWRSPSPGAGRGNEAGAGDGRGGAAQDAGRASQDRRRAPEDEGERGQSDRRGGAAARHPASEGAFHQGGADRPVGPVGISAIDGDPESKAYAEQIRDLLEDAGYDVGDELGSIRLRQDTLIGLRVGVHSKETAPLHALPLAANFIDADISAFPVINQRVPAGAVEVTIGTNPAAMNDDLPAAPAPAKEPAEEPAPPAVDSQAGCHAGAGAHADARADADQNRDADSLLAREIGGAEAEQPQPMKALLLALSLAAAGAAFAAPDPVFDVAAITAVPLNPKVLKSSEHDGLVTRASGGGPITVSTGASVLVHSVSFGPSHR